MVLHSSCWICVLGYFVMSSLFPDTFSFLFQEFLEWMWKSKALSLSFQLKQRISVPVFHVTGLLNLLSRTNTQCLFFGDINKIALIAFQWLCSCCLGVGYIWDLQETELGSYLKYYRLLKQLNVKMDRTVLLSSNAAMKLKALHSWTKVWI